MMKRGLLILLIILTGCEVIHKGDEYLWDTDTGVATDTEVVDPGCFDGDACTANTVAECWEGVGDNPKEFLRKWGQGCTCRDGKLEPLFRDERCLHGCTVNPIGQDFCNPDPEGTQ